MSFVVISRKLNYNALILCFVDYIFNEVYTLMRATYFPSVLSAYTDDSTLLQFIRLYRSMALMQEKGPFQDAFQITVSVHMGGKIKG